MTDSENEETKYRVYMTTHGGARGHDFTTARNPRDAAREIKNRQDVREINDVEEFERGSINHPETGSAFSRK